jgi:hypothetical protein
MEAIREQIGRNWVLIVVALIVGVALGVFYAWQLNPVEWKDASPDLLRPDLRVDYMRMAVDSYSINKDVDLAIERYDRLGKLAGETLDEVGANPGEVDTTAIQNFSAVVEIMEEEAAPEVGPDEPAVQPAEGEPAEAEQPTGSTAVRLLLPVCGATALLGLLLVGALILRNRLGGTEEEPILEPGFDIRDEFGEPFEDDYAEIEEPASTYEEVTAATETADAEALATFRTIYSLGDDRYDDSFSIESAAGDFMGECGVGVGEVMGAGEPKKVSAFEVWLFDKNDIQTVTKVLLSSYAYRDEETRARLSAKGDPMLAEPGSVVELETASLRVEARIVDMTYGQSALPNESYFERMTIELRALPKAA